MTQPADRGSSLQFGRMAIFATIAVPVDALLAVTLIYMPAYFAATLGVSLVSVGAIFATCRTVDIPLGPALGAIMDRTRSRFGRYRLWAMLGAPILTVGMIMLLRADTGTSAWHLGVWLFLVYVGMTILQLAHSAWAASLARSYADRARLFGIMMGIGAAGALATISLPVIMGRLGHSDAEGLRAMFLAIPITAIVTVAGVAALIPERISAEVVGRNGFRLRDYPALLAHPVLARLLGGYVLFILGPSWASAMSLFFVRDRLGLTLGDVSVLLLFAGAGGIVGAQMGGWLAARIGKHWAAIVLVLLEVICMGALLLVPHGHLLAAVPSYFVNGFSNIGFGAVARSMMADVADDIRLETGREHSGVLFSMITFLQQVGAAIAIGVSFPLLAWAGYDPKLGLGNTGDALFDMAFIAVAGPVVFPLLGAVLLLGYKLTATRVEQTRRLLDARDAAAIAPPAAEPAAVAAASP